MRDEGGTGTAAPGDAPVRLGEPVQRAVGDEVHGLEEEHELVVPPRVRNLDPALRTLSTCIVPADGRTHMHDRDLVLEGHGPVDRDERDAVRGCPVPRPAARRREARVLRVHECGRRPGPRGVRGRGEEIVHDGVSPEVARYVRVVRRNRRVERAVEIEKRVDERRRRRVRLRLRIHPSVPSAQQQRRQHGRA
jgi:hypothetical protein